MTTWTILDSAHQALRTAVAGVDESSWDVATPCEQWTVTQVLQHAAGDQLGYAEAITGEGGPTYDPFAPDGRLTGTGADFLEPTLRAAHTAWTTIDENADAAPTPLPHGPFPAAIGAGACALDAAVHAWDIAVATGQPSPLTAEMAEVLLPAAQAIVEPLRAYGAYAVAIPTEPGDDAVDTLLRYLGRDPGWSASSKV
jgi:uncharacterized protein (TIGR03086 family)